MATSEAQLKRRLGRVRRRWRLTGGLRGLLLVITEALGMFLVFMLADWIYSFTGITRLVLLCGAGAALAVLFVRHCIYPMLRPISDEQIALLIEERSPQAEGAVVSAVEFRRDRRSGLHGFIVDFLVGDAVERIDRTPARLVSNLRRLRKHAIIAGVLLAIFAVTTITAPTLLLPRAGRIIAPWVSIRAEREEARRQADEERAREIQRHRPIEFDVLPGNHRMLRGGHLRIAARLSRHPTDAPHVLYRIKKGQKWQEWAALPDPMAEVEGLHDYVADMMDINQDTEYRIQVPSTGQKSAVFRITVYQQLAIRGIEATYRYPKYLDLEPETKREGDISAPVGTKVDLKVLANNPLQAGAITFEEAEAQPLKVGKTAADGATFSFQVTKNTSYEVAVRDVDGQSARSDQFYYVKAVPDEKPTVEMTSPRVDMSIHPLCEVTFGAKVSDDFGIKDATVKGELYRDGKATALSFPMKVSDETGRTKNVKEGKAQYVYETESAKPKMQVGDMMFYHLSVTDRKGQVVKTDVFYVKMWPLETAATWPTSIAPPDLPHETFNDPMDLMLFLAAAWKLEQERGEIPEGEFNAKSEKIAQRMEVGSPPDFGSFWGHGGAPEGGGPNSAQILADATQHIETAHGLLKREHQPGKAAGFMRVALAMVETLSGDKRLLELELNPEPIHTGQPSSGHSDDPVMEQIEFRPPSVMSDAITAFQQPDNPPRLLPPDYRRALRIKQRQAARTKQLKVAGEIYASEEQLIEMAKEQLGHIQLREAIDDNTPPDPAASGGTGGEEQRVDKRAIPYKEMVTAEERRSQVAEADKLTLSKPKIETVKGLPRHKLRDNKRRGGSNPYMSQAAGGSGGEQEPEDPDDRDTKDPRARERRLRAMRMRPPMGGSSSGGEPDEGGMPMPGQPMPGAASAGQRLAGQQTQLASQTAQLARDVAQSMGASDRMTAKAVDDLRGAAREMRKAATSFRRGDIRGGIARARRAQKTMRAATHRLQASQHGSLEAAVAAAQDAAAALAANQYRISQGTQQVAKRVGELTGRSQPGQGQPGKGEPGKGEPGKGQPATGQPGKAEPGKGQPGQGQPGKGQPGKGEPAAPSREAVAKAATRDPRLGARMKGLAKEQANLRNVLGGTGGRAGFMEYVKSLNEWAGEAAKTRVSDSLGAVTAGLRKKGTGQKMVDASVDLASGDVKSALKTQKGIEQDLEAAVAGLNEAGEILAGSPTGILRSAARTAKEIGAQAAQLASRGQPGQGQPGQGQPGQGQPGKGEPGKGEPGKGEPGKGEPGKGEPGKGEPGKGEPGKGEPGKGEPGKGEPGKGEPGKGEPGKGLAQYLAGQDTGGQSGEQAVGRPGGGKEITELWMKTRRLMRTLQKEGLAEDQTIRYVDRRSTDINKFKKMFERANRIEAGKFANVMMAVGANLEAALEEALSAKRLHAEQREECPPRYRALVNAYFEALSKAVSSKEQR